MKTRFWPLFLTIFIGYLGPLWAQATLKEIWFEEDAFGDAAYLEAEMQNETFARSVDIENLQRAKFHLINGQLIEARGYLNRIDDKLTRLFVIKNRYLATIAFIEGNHKQSLQYLADKRFYETSNYAQVCLLKLINFMAINDNESLKRERNPCMLQTSRSSKNDQYWLDTMVKLKLGDSPGIRKNLLADVEYTLSDDEMSRLWLKTGLYLNREKDVLQLLDLLSENSYQSKRLREIVAFMYLRKGSPGDIEKALAFIDDIDSANAENIKGNVNLKNKEYELAFGHFRLALQKKADSTNSLERAIPLAWLLNQWPDGLSMLDNITNKNIDPRNIRAIRIAFLIKNKQFSEAQKELTLLKIDFQNEPPFEVSIMDSYVSLIMAATEKKVDLRKVEDSTEKACQEFDGVSCWMSLQFVSWSNLGKTIKRDESIWTDKEMTIDSLKERKPTMVLKETVTVDQRDIEELDSAGIDLMNR